MSSPATTLSLFLLSLLLLSSSSSSAVDDTLTVYEALEEYDFPVGLLPLGVTSYTLDRETGEFEVNIGKTCTFSIDGYTLRYKSTISGVISKDKLTKLKGVSVKVLLFYIDIVEVTRDGDELDFSMGILSVGFGIENFVESPQCGCGFDCNSIRIGGISNKGKKMDLKKHLLPPTRGESPALVVDGGGLGMIEGGRELDQRDGNWGRDFDGFHGFEKSMDLDCCYRWRRWRW